MNRQEIANELSKIYLENYLILEREKYNRDYNVIEITRIYLSIYKQILKILIDLKIFNGKINEMAYSIALIYFNKNIKENIYDDVTVYIKEFIDSYKYAITEINKDYMLKSLLEESNGKDIKNNIQNRIYRK